VKKGKKGKKHSAETCANISKAMKGKKPSTEICAKIKQGEEGQEALRRDMCQN
jgi:hypothetical protein